MNLLEVSLDKLMTILGTDPDHGLTGEQVLRNRREFGENIQFEKKNTAIDLVKKIFGDVMMILFLLLSIFDFLQNGNHESLIVALSVVFLYACFMLCTHFYVSDTKKKIERFSKSKYHVRRGGRVRSVSKSELVPGDILLMEKGDVMPCDGIILKHSALKILEASVTGRREPIFKRSHEEVEAEGSGLPYFECILFAGSAILHGSAKVFVCNTGRDIFDLDNFAVSRQNTTVPQIYDKCMELKKQVSLVWVLCCFLLFAWGLFRSQDVFSSFYYVVALVVAAFPDSMEHLSDLAIALMTRRLFSVGVVLRNPGSVDRLCDSNCILVHDGDYLFHSHPIASQYSIGEALYDFRNDPSHAAPLLEGLLLSQSNRKYYSDKRDEWHAEKAILSAAATLGIQKNRLDKEFLHIRHYDFDPKFGFACTLVMFDGAYRLIVRGRPESVLEVCSTVLKDGEAVELTSAIRLNLRANARHLAGVCERTVGVAVLGLTSPTTGDQRSLCRNMTYLGIFGLSTPVSASAANAVNICQKSGVQTYLMTDDYPETIASLSKSVSIIGPDDYQYALFYQTYERMDRGVFVADIDKYKAYCGFPTEEKQNIVRYHKENGDITLTLTDGMYDMLPQMESDISVVCAEEKRGAVRLNSDLLFREKKFDLVPLCINWARIFYRSVVHVMQYQLFVQVAIGLVAFIALSFSPTLSLPILPLVLCGFASSVVAGINVFCRRPGPRLEHNREVLQDDRVASLRELVIIPVVAGASAALSAAIACRIGLFALGSEEAAGACALITILYASYFSSLSMKFDSSLFGHVKDLGRSDLYSFLSILIFSAVLFATPLRGLWLSSIAFDGFGFWPIAFALLLALVPMGVMEWMKFLKKDDTAFVRDQNSTKGENE